MKLLKRLGLGMVFLIIAIQFVPVNRQHPAVDAKLDYLTVSGAPAELGRLLKTACYDCHSYETKYPWYAYIAPVSFLVQNHIQEGRAELNFSKWGNNSANLDETLEEIPEVIAEGEMPLWDYAMMHPESKLDNQEKKLLIDWFRNGSTQQMQPHHEQNQHREEED